MELLFGFYFPKFCAISMAMPPATTEKPMVKKNQKNHWA